MVSEFKEFIQRGNFIDLAVGFVMGAAVAGVVDTLVDRVIMPTIALMIGQPNFDAIGTFGDRGSIGALITALVNFLLIAIALFLIIKGYNALQRKAEEDEPATTEALLEEILVELRASKGPAGPAGGSAGGAAKPTD